ncbi:MAG TPA: alkaline phosphatase family protein [Pseudonocardiaceae bacterium]|jgi:phospholipase C|nr:alkaline phosphatase family protein [Pseudonocardiaceae bacterium]
MPELTRRRLLGTAAGAAAAAAAATLMPPNVQQALAQPLPARGSIRDIEHIVVLMQENRSFDHYYGTLSGVRGFADAERQKLANGRSVLFQPDAVNPDGYTLPFHLNTNTTSAQHIPSTSHAWQVQHNALNGGKMDSWLPAHRKADGVNGPYVMGYHERSDIPFQFALAEAFTICDNYYCSVLGPTWPNRMMWMTGTVDADGRNGGPILDNNAPAGGYTWTTYAERLEAAGVSWKVYQQQDNYGTNMLAEFKNFQQSKAGDPLFDKGIAFGPEGQFEFDARNDKLPTVSWILPTSFQSEHPDFTPADGAAFVASKIDAIAANPKVWAKTAFILNYDENDGLFDHVVPPLPPAGTPGEFVTKTSPGKTPGNGLSVGGGYRVPAIIVSPWTAGGWVSSEAFDHTSVLQFMELVTGVKETNISGWRRSTFGDMSSVFRFNDRKAAPPVLPDTAGPLTYAQYTSSVLPKPVVPGASQSLPRQEPGGRKHLR